MCVCVCFVLVLLGPLPSEPQCVGPHSSLAIEYECAVFRPWGDGARVTEKQRGSNSGGEGNLPSDPLPPAPPLPSPFSQTTTTFSLDTPHWTVLSFLYHSHTLPLLKDSLLHSITSRFFFFSLGVLFSYLNFALVSEPNCHSKKPQCTYFQHKSKGNGFILCKIIQLKKTDFLVIVQLFICDVFGHLCSCGKIIATAGGSYHEQIIVKLNIAGKNINKLQCWQQRLH